jgi:Domain of unknown function (DUF4034)
MGSLPRIQLLLVPLSFVLLCGCSKTSASPRVDRGPALQAVNDDGREQSSQSFSASSQANSQATVVAPPAEDEMTYEGEMYAKLVGRQFDELDQIAREARVKQTRFPGGVWVLYDLYAGLSEPMGANEAAESDWNNHIDLLKAWIAARPESVTPRLALAETYVKFSYKARGDGYASTVSRKGWNLYYERNDLALSVLIEAAKLKERCPFWFEVMQHVVLAQGWEKQQARQLLDRAIAFEPHYYHFYREYAYYLLPKWYGARGDAEAFADETLKHVPGPEGKFLYFEIASLLTCQCDSTDSDMENLSWPTIKEGYTAMGQMYGYSNLKQNRYAHMAVEASDQATAREVFVSIGDDWDHQVWHSNANFENAKRWAMGDVAP